MIGWSARTGTARRATPSTSVAQASRRSSASPVTARTGEVLGTLCAIAGDARYLSDRVIAQVKLLARIVADHAERDGAVEAFSEAWSAAALI